MGVQLLVRFNEERDTYVDINISELGCGLFKETTPQEEYSKHISFDQNNQPFSTWDPSVMAPKYDKEPKWDEFPFDPDDVQNSEYNASYEIAIGEEDVFDEEVCMVKLQNDLSKTVEAAKEEFAATEISEQRSVVTL